MYTKYRSLQAKTLRSITRLLLFLLLITVLQVRSHAGTPATAASDPSGVSQEHTPPAQVQGDETRGPELQASAVEHLFWHEAVGGPAFLDAKRVDAVDLGLSEKQAEQPEEVARAFLQAYQAELKITQPSSEWDPIRTETDRLGMQHVFLQQTYRGLRVFASQLAVHVEKGAVTAANGEYLPAVSVSPKPAVSVDAAFKIVLHELNLKKPVLVSDELVIYNPALLDAGPSANHLAYYLIVEDAGKPASYTAFIDAHTGKLLIEYSNLQTGKNRDIRDLNGSESLPGPQCYSESGPIGTPSADCLGAFNFTGNTYDYFLDTHGRDSFDNGGATMRASVRFGTDANAFWNGLQTAYGPGFATKDVVAHEWTHAVTQYTAGLEYIFQPGALNESMSDIFGAMVDRDDWLMGEDTPIGTIRSLSNPGAFGQPGKVSDSEFYCGSENHDNGGVHINSGVPNHAAFLMSEGGTYNGVTVTGVGREPTEEVFYQALTAHLTSGSGFNDAYNALISSCHDIFGSGTGECDAVMLATQAVEMNDQVCGGGGAGTPDSYEDDDLFTQASNIIVDDDAQSHNFHDAGDNDWAQFSAVSGTSYVIETFNLGQLSDTVVSLYDTDGTTELTEDDDGGTGRASRIEWVAPADGTYYVRVRHYNSGIFGADTDYDLRVTSDDSGGGGSGAPDSYEPDDTYDQASDITVNGATQNHNFHDAGDNDWGKFSATEGLSYVVETSNLGVDSDTYLELYDIDGVTLIAQDDDGGAGYASRIEWTAPTDGTYYVRVHHFTSGAFGANTNYDLRVTTGGVVPDDYEPDDSASQASSIIIDGDAQTHNHHVAGDADWVKFSATNGCSYVIETSNLGADGDTYLELYDSDGTTLLVSNDDGGTGYASRIAWTAPADGTYYVRVRHYSSSVYGVNTNYDLQVTSSGCGGAGDAYEPDDTAGLAGAITVNGAAQTHNFHDAGDYDWVEFAATAGTDYVVETFNLGSQSDTVLELYDTDGSTLLTSNDDGGDGLASRIAWMAPADGTYHVRVRHYSSGAYGADTNYDVRVTGTGTSGDPDAYEEDDTGAQASTIIVNGSSQTHNFHDVGDYDWVQFTATSGIDYSVETLNLGSRSDTYLSLYDTDGSSLIAEDDDGGFGLASAIAWTAPADGTYYVRVRHFDSSVSGANTEYDLRITSSSPDGADAYEPDDTAGQASTITVNGSAQTHNFHQSGDQDWVEFSATAGVAHTLQTFNLGPASDTYLELYDSDATTLITANDDGGGGLASRIQWTPASSGVYYMKVRHYASSASGSDTNYDLQAISASSGGGDAYEPDDSVSEASIITVGGDAQTHNFHYAGDNDWVQFSTTAGNVYVIETLTLGPVGDTYLYLYDVDGTTILEQDDDGGPGLASRIEWTAPTDDVYYLKVRHFSSSTTGSDTSYDLQVTSAGCVGGDAYEPDNSAGLANVIVTDGTIQTHDFFCAGDVDWVAFSGVAGISYVIETLNLGSSSDTVLYLYDTDATTLLDQNDDGGDGLASLIEWTAPADGTYYARVRHYSSSASGANTDYDLRVSGTDAGAPDAYEPDDTSGEASVILTDGTIQAHNFHAEGDEDWVIFDATAGSTCIIETSNLGGLSDTVLRLYDTDASSLLELDDDGGAGLASRIVHTFASAGTYYAKVNHYFSGTFGPDTEYDLQVSCSGDGVDVYEPDDSPGQASTIAVNGGAQAHNFHVAGDEDWASFSATAGVGYVIETLNLGSAGDTVMQLYDTDGATLIDEDDDSGDGFASRIEWTAPGDGTYYVRVDHFDGSAYGPDTSYDLQVTTLGCVDGDAYEPDDSVGLANPIATNGMPQTHDFFCAGDIDWVSFSATAGVGYVIETLNLGSAGDTVMQLYDSDRVTLIDEDDDGGDGFASRIEWTAPAGGTYYVRVRHFSETASGADTNYDLKVTGSDTGTPDAYEPDDTSDQASVITTDGTVQSHNFHMADDIDWVQFAATAGAGYVIETLNLGSSSDTVLYLYDTDATTIIDVNDDGGGGFASRIEWTAPAGGTYYALVHHFDSSTHGPDTSYDLRVSSAAANLRAPAITVDLENGTLQSGDTLEATVYVHRAVSAIKVETWAKPIYLNLTDATPLSVAGKPAGSMVTADASRWQTITAPDGRTSVWYSAKPSAWDGKTTYPVLRLRWQLTAPLPTRKLAIPVRLTAINRNGQADTQMVDLTVVMLGSNPKIDDVQPETLTNDTDTVISLMGSGFVNKPKVYLRSGSNQVQLGGVTFDNSELVWATVPAGTKASVYKVRLVNPDGGSTEFADGITVATGCYDFDSPVGINVEDIQPVAGRWHSSSEYDAKYDVVLDGEINILDIMKVVASWGQTCN